MSYSPWATRIHLVDKGNNKWRVVGDFHELNIVTVSDWYPISRLQDSTVNLYGRTIFTRLDLNRAFYQIPEDVSKTAIMTPFGLNELP